MSYNLAYSVLTPITNGETGLQIQTSDPRILDAPPANGALPVTNLFGIDLHATAEAHLLGMTFQFNVGFYLCAVMLILAFYLSMRIFRSPFGLMLKAIRTNQNRLGYIGVSTRPYALSRLRDLRHVRRAWPAACSPAPTPWPAPSACSGPPRARWC